LLPLSPPRSGRDCPLPDHATAPDRFYTSRVIDAPQNIYLVGPTGSGKTAVGRQLAKITGREFLDCDLEIEKRTGVEVSYIFEKEGEAGFRERERDMLAELAGHRGVIIATGGGAVLAEVNRQILADTGTVVYLRTGIAEQLRRTGRSRKRPLLNQENPRAVLEAMAATRRPLYEQIADLELDTSHQRVRAVAQSLKDMLIKRGVLPLQS
jgi:shikimate kinase